MKALTQYPEVFVRQKRELAELFGFETRNKYEIVDSRKNVLGFAAEQNKGLMGFLGRQFLGHWRSFELTIFDAARNPAYKALHPFRFFFQRLELFTSDGRAIGAVQQRFAFLYKKFDIQDPSGQLLFTMSSAPWKIWTFPFKRGNEEVAVLRKKWSGMFSEVFMDKDNFQIAFAQPSLTQDERMLILTSAIFVDLQYFEKKAD